MVNIVGQSVSLLIVAIRELATQVVLFLLLLFVLHLVFDVHYQIAVLVQTDAAELLLQSRSGYIHYIGFLVFLYVNSGSRSIYARHHISVKEILKSGI